MDSVGNISDGTETTVSEIVDKIAFSVSPATALIKKGGTQTITKSITSGEASSYAWSSSNTSVATVDSSGVVTAATVGTATITCTATNYDGTTSAQSSTVTIVDCSFTQPNGTYAIKYTNSTASNATLPGKATVSAPSGTTIQYQWGTSSSIAPTGTWTTYTSGSTIDTTVTNTTSRYFWIKFTSGTNNVFYCSNEYKVAAGQITLTPNSTAANQSQVTVTIGYPDVLTSDKTVTYKIGSNNATQGTDYTVSGNVVTVYTNNLTISVSAKDQSGKNQSTANYTVSNIYVFQDTTAPSVTVSTTSTSTNSISVRATASDDASNITSIIYYYKKSSASSWSSVTDSSFTSSTYVTSTKTITGLDSGTSYNIYAKAITSAGPDGESSTITATTDTPTPTDTSAPSVTITTTSIGTSSISVRATATDDMSNINSITYYYKKASASSWSTVTDSSFTASTSVTSTKTITGLDSGTSYNIYAKAITAAGPNGESSTITATTDTPVEASVMITALNTVKSGYTYASGDRTGGNPLIVNIASEGTSVTAWGYNTSSTTQPSWTSKSIPDGTSENVEFTPALAGGTYYVWAKDSSGNTYNQSVSVAAAHYSTLKSSTTTYYNNLGQAFTGSTSSGGDSGGGTITVYDDNTDSSTASTNKTVTINTNGKTVTRSTAIQSTGGTLTICGNGKLKCTSTGTEANDSVINTSANLTVNDTPELEGAGCRVLYVNGTSSVITLYGGYYYTSAGTTSTINLNKFSSGIFLNTYVFTPSGDASAIWTGNSTAGTLVINGDSRIGNGINESTNNSEAGESAITWRSTGELQVNGTTRISAGPGASYGISVRADCEIWLNDSSSIYALRQLSKSDSTFTYIANCVHVEAAGSGSKVYFNSDGYFYSAGQYVASVVNSLYAEQGDYYFYPFEGGHFVSRMNKYMFHDIALDYSNVAEGSAGGRNFWYMQAYNHRADNDGTGYTGTTRLTGCYYYAP